MTPRKYERRYMAAFLRTIQRTLFTPEMPEFINEIGGCVLDGDEITYVIAPFKRVFVAAQIVDIFSLSPQGKTNSFLNVNAKSFLPPHEWVVHTSCVVA